MRAGNTIIVNGIINTKNIVNTIANIAIQNNQTINDIIYNPFAVPLQPISITNFVPSADGNTTPFL
jgi:hypothetical protein